MILTESIKGLENTSARDFTLPGCNGQTYSLASFADAKVLVVMFICNHCPYVIAVKDRLNALNAEFKDRGIAFVAINSNDAEAYPDDGFDKMPALGLEFPYLFDEDQMVATKYHAVCTPDIFVFNAERKLAYHGRIDDSWKEPENVSKRELAEAIEKTLAGETIAREDQIPSMGCSIKWKK